MSCGICKRNGEMRIFPVMEKFSFLVGLFPELQVTTFYIRLHPNECVHMNAVFHSPAVPIHESRSMMLLSSHCKSANDSQSVFDEIQFVNLIRITLAHLKRNHADACMRIFASAGPLLVSIAHDYSICY